MLKPALIGGGAAGFLSALPLVGALNCLCCCLVVGGGFLAAYLYSGQCRASGVEFRAGTGAKVGLYAAVFFALVSAIVSFLSRFVYPQDPDEIMSQFESANMPPEALEWIGWAVQMMFAPLGILIGFLFGLIIGAIFSTIGGLIGGAAFKVEPRAGTPGV
jgi:hypothetical protein